MIKTSMIRSDKAVSEILGMVMLISIMILVIGGILLAGVPMIESGKDRARMDVATNSFLSMQNDIEEVVRGPIWIKDPNGTNINGLSPSRETEFELMGGALSVFPGSDGITYYPSLNDPIIIMVSNSTGNYGYKAQATSKNIYANNFPYSNVSSQISSLTTPELNLASDNDILNYFKQSGSGNKDEIIWVNFTLPNVESVNYVVVKTTMKTVNNDTDVFGAYNRSNARWEKLNSSTGSWQYFTYNISSTNDKNRWLYIDPNNNLNFSLAVWGNGDLNDDVYLSYFEANVTYFNIPLNITSYSLPYPNTASMNGTPMTFNVTLNHSAKVDWYMNGTKIQSNTSVTSASFTNSTAIVGVWNVTASADDGLSSDSRTWYWNVTAVPPSLLIVSVSEIPDPVTSGNTSQVTVQVVNSTGGPVSGASVDVSANGGGLSPTSGTTNVSGYFVSTYTAPTVTTTTTYTISSNATKAGYTNSIGSNTITVNPPSYIPANNTISISSGNITYTAGQESIIYENGAVIRKYEGGEPIMVSDPLISIYDTGDGVNITISIHAISINGTHSSAGGDGKAWVETRLQNYSQIVEPSGTPNLNQTNITIFSKYPDAWREFFDKKLQGAGLVNSSQGNTSGYYIGSGTPLEVQIYGKAPDNTTKDIFLSVYESKLDVKVR